MKNTWILIANSCEARLFKANRSTKDMKLISEFHHPKSRCKVHELMTDGAGRYRKGGPSPGGIYTEETNPKEVEIERFAHELAARLNEGRNKNLYENLILIAPSHFQGLLNRYCNPHVKNLVTRTVDKDYTKLTEHELLTHLNGKVRWHYAA